MYPIKPYSYIQIRINPNKHTYVHTYKSRFIHTHIFSYMYIFLNTNLHTYLQTHIGIICIHDSYILT